MLFLPRFSVFLMLDINFTRLQFGVCVLRGAGGGRGEVGGEFLGILLESKDLME